MPYISRSEREVIDAALEGVVPLTAGQLNYTVTKLCLRYLRHSPTYTEYNAVIGALECAKLELYRMQVAPYEDGKILEHGNVRP